MQHAPFHDEGRVQLPGAPPDLQPALFVVRCSLLVGCTIGLRWVRNGLFGLGFGGSQNLDFQDSLDFQDYPLRAG
ncbi:MAG: hypothetical protein D6765_07010, partial [Bacteroidetes bacterium]